MAFLHKMQAANECPCQNSEWVGLSIPQEQLSLSLLYSLMIFKLRKDHSRLDCAICALSQKRSRARRSLGGCPHTETPFPTSQSKFNPKLTSVCLHGI